MVARYLGEQGALGEQHKGQHAVERAQRHCEMQATHPVAGAVLSPWIPGQQKGEGVERRAVQDGEAAA